MIDWRTGQSPGGTTRHLGYLGDVQVFVVQWGFASARDTPYVVHCNLPGLRDAVQVKDVEAGKALAERMLARFLERTGLWPHPEA